jgi:hypothetical protein
MELRKSGKYGEGWLIHEGMTSLAVKFQVSSLLLLRY